MLKPVRTVEPTELPVTLDEVKQVCRVYHDDDNAWLTTLAKGAVKHLDGYSGVLGQAIVTQTWRQDFCAFSGCMRLPVGPYASDAVVTYFDAENNASQTLADTVYQVLTDARGPFVSLKPDQSWPSTYSRPDAVSVTYVAGKPAAQVSPDIKTAILMRVKADFDPPGAETAILIERAESIEAKHRFVGV